MIDVLAALDPIERYAVIFASVAVVGVFLFLLVLVTAVIKVAKSPANEPPDQTWRVGPSDVV